ncbi:MAG TPA: multidrug effflux MFS transporter [Roseiarcus sp.]|jgi:DHA1 family bicyclomycin/chloramphenicol resistance-like MFS transporter
MNRHVADVPAHSEAAAGSRRHVPLWMLAMFALSATLGMHIFVPALPNAAADLKSSPGALQLTISLYIAGLAIGQLVYGPLADRFGRRPALIGGLILFTASGFAAFLAQSIDALIVARLFQALGGCSGLVLARAIVRDTSAAHEATERLALMNLMVTVGPGIAPLVGGALAGLFGWRAILVALCALGAVNSLCAWRLLPETGVKLASVDGAALLRNYGRLLASPAFLGYAIGGGCATTSLYAFIASAPFIIVNQLHRPEHEIGLYLAILVSGIWLGSVLTSRLVARFSLQRFLVAANALSVAAAFALLALVLSGHLSLAPMVGLMLLYNVGVGSASPAALVQAISVNKRAVGSASGLYGFAQMAVGAALTALAGLGRDPALAAAVVLAFAGVVAQASFFIAMRHEARFAAKDSATAI